MRLFHGADLLSMFNYLTFFPIIWSFDPGVPLLSPMSAHAAKQGVALNTASMWRTSTRVMIIFLFVILLSPRETSAKEPSQRYPSFRLLEAPSVRTEFVNTPNEQPVTILLQQDGSVDTVKNFFLELTQGLSPENVSFVQSSSNSDVLAINGNDNIVVSSSSDVMNVTCTLDFDGFVGETEYVLKAVHAVTGEELSAVTVPFIISGMTFYVRSQNGNTAIVSGDGNGYFVSYSEALSRVITEETQIRVLIQLPNGTSISSNSDLPIPGAATMQTSVSQFAGQFEHSENECNVEQPGVLLPNGSLSLAAGCGYGFFSGLSDHACFGINFEPYRAGNFSIQYLWSGLTAQNAALSEEIFEFVLHVYITGEPPVAVFGILPEDKLWRPEGGEVARFYFINAVNRNAASFRVPVTNISNPYNSIYGSFESFGSPNFSETISFLTEPGYGTGLEWNLEYQIGSATAASEVAVFETAVVVPGFQYTFNYDSRSLEITSLSPDFGDEEGGIDITITGYFPSFDPNVDGIFFSGTKIDPKYIRSVTMSSITCELPPKSELGDSYEFYVTIRMGNAVSNSKLFSFVVKDAVVRISQSGTSEVDEETFRVGNCTAVSFTAIVSPFTSQIQSYTWTLHVLGDSSSDLLSSPALQQSSNSSLQTLLLDPDLIDAGPYALKVSVGLLGKDLEKEIILLREYVISIGAFILQPPTRSVAFPDAPLRLSAVVRPPGACYTGNQTMIFEWTAFGETQVFSSTNATGSLSDRNLTTTPARLGWEYVVPRENLVPGNHSVIFKVSMASDPLVSGQALSHVVIKQANLVPLIRSGEEQISVNYASVLNLYGTKSYDPDVLMGDQTAGLTYEWLCRQASSTNFSSETSSTCLPSLIPNSSAPEFPVTIGDLEASSEITHLQYTLIVRKGIDRVSPQVTLTVEIQNRGNLPFLDDFEITLTNGDGVIQDWDRVAHFERTIISVHTSSQVSWTYDLLEPSEPDFFTSANLINNPIFFSADANLFSVSGNTKPLGIEAGSLRPFSTFKFKILFDGSQEFESTSVVVSIRTLEAPIIGLAVPSVTSGTSNTTFTATAGIPNNAEFTGFSYYFIINDAAGNNFCVAGCTGYEVAHFRIGRPGNYTLSAFIFDMQGKALIDSQTLATNITVMEGNTETGYLAALPTLFENGDDNAWTQLAHDVALMLLETEPVEGTVRMLLGDSLRQEDATTEDVLAAKMEAALNISLGARKIFCSSYPNSYHGSDCMSLSSDLMQMSLLDEETVYNVMIAVQCCVENTPLRTINKMGDMFKPFLENLNQMARTIEQGGNSRRRLLQTSGEPPNLLADIKTWTTTQLSASVTSGQLDGYATTLPIGNNEKFGHVSIVVASNPGHLPVQTVNGEQRRIILGPSGDELFYATGNCLTKMFSPSSDRRRFFVLYSVENFLIEGFQDPPEGSNLADRLYWQQVFEQGPDGRFTSIEIAKEDKCFCWRLPILRRLQFLEDSVDFMAGMYAVANVKDFGVDVIEKGTAYTYVYDGQVTSSYSTEEGWVEACQDQVGMVGSTLVSRSSQNALGDGNATILGTGGAVIVGLVVGGLLFVVVAMASAWIFATRAVSDVAAPLAALAPNEMYVERDVYGRGTIFDVNAVTLPSTDD